MSAVRTCPICSEPVVRDRHEADRVYCSVPCARTGRSRHKAARRAFLSRAKRPVSIDAVAAWFGCTVDEATTRAEHDIAAGRLLGWRHRDGRLAEVSSLKRSAGRTTKGSQA